VLSAVTEAVVEGEEDALARIVNVAVGQEVGEGVGGTVVVLLTDLDTKGDLEKEGEGEMLGEVVVVPVANKEGVKLPERVLMVVPVRTGDTVLPVVEVVEGEEEGLAVFTEVRVAAIVRVALSVAPPLGDSVLAPLAVVATEREGEEVVLGQWDMECV
jgi:hypothetical protein